MSREERPEGFGWRREGVHERGAAVPLPKPGVYPYLGDSEFIDRGLDCLQTSVVGTTVDFADPWVIDRGEVSGQLVGLLDAVSGKGDIGWEAGGGWDGGVVGSCGGVEGEVCAELEGMLGGKEEGGEGRRERTPWRVR